VISRPSLLSPRSRFRTIIRQVPAAGASLRPYTLRATLRVEPFLVCMSLNIGIVTEYYYPLLGGISENVHHTGKELMARGHRVTLITPEPRANGHQFTIPNGIPITRVGRSVPLYGNGATAYFAVGSRVLRDLRHALDEGGFDIVQLHSPLFFMLPPLAALLARCPRVGTFHSYFDNSLTYALFKSVLQKQFLRRLAGVTVVAPSVATAMSRYFEMNARVIPNGVDTCQFNPEVPRIERFGPDKRTLLFLGRFDPRNGLPFMLRAFELVKQRVPDVRLVVVGTGTFKGLYEKFVPRSVTEDVHFEGPQLLERPSYYATADIFCSPISKASFGITLLEAMATGKPIVATENLGYRDLLGPEESVLVPYNERAFADAIVRLLNDDQRRAEMGRAARQKAEQYAWPVVVSQLLEYFNEILGRS
jgi:phosphatidylinositol alpha-mannosyltransferase